jgi:hypothetical protein
VDAAAVFGRKANHGQRGGLASSHSLRYVFEVRVKEMPMLSMLFLLGFALPPNTPVEAPAPRAKPETITFLLDKTVRITLPLDKEFTIHHVETTDGPRVKIVSSGMTIEAKWIEFQLRDAIHTLEVGNAGFMNMSQRPVPKK